MKQEVQAGMRFVKNDVVLEVVKPNPKIPGDWFCRSTECDTGLWSYAQTDILNNLAPNGIELTGAASLRPSETE
jgi:hypothetical protein